jgi:hypothetical protein
MSIQETANQSVVYLRTQHGYETQVQATVVIAHEQTDQSKTVVALGDTWQTAVANLVDALNWVADKGIHLDVTYESCMLGAVARRQALHLAKGRTQICY